MHHLHDGSNPSDPSYGSRRDFPAASMVQGREPLAHGPSAPRNSPTVNVDAAQLRRLLAERDELRSQLTATSLRGPTSTTKLKPQFDSGAGSDRAPSPTRSPGYDLRDRDRDHDRGSSLSSHLADMSDLLGSVVVPLDLPSVFDKDIFSDRVYTCGMLSSKTIRRNFWMTIGNVNHFSTWYPSVSYHRIRASRSDILANLPFLTCLKLSALDLFSLHASYSTIRQAFPRPNSPSPWHTSSRTLPGPR